MEKSTNTATAIDPNLEAQKNTAGIAPKEEAPKIKTVDNLLQNLKTPREQIERPKFLDDVQFIDGETSTENTVDDEDDVPGEQITDDDAANMGYLNYSEEHKTQAMFLIITLDRILAWIAGFLASESPEAYRKIETRAAISEDYLDVTAAIVKKYQTKMSLEVILVTTIVAIYAPTMTLAYTKGKMKKAQEEKQKAA